MAGCAHTQNESSVSDKMRVDDAVAMIQNFFPSCCNKLHIPAFLHCVVINFAITGKIANVSVCKNDENADFLCVCEFGEGEIIGFRCKICLK